MQIYGETLRIFRTMKKLTQAGVASEIGVSQQEYSKWENRKVVSNKCVDRFLQALNCKKEDLLLLQDVTLNGQNDPAQNTN